MMIDRFLNNRVGKALLVALEARNVGLPFWSSLKSAWTRREEGSLA
jgi:hypothetical protein